MLSFRDNLTLSATKLRGRRVRLIVTLIVSALLFGVLILGSVLIRGTLASLESFTKDGFSSRFFVMVMNPGADRGLEDEKAIKRAEEIHKALVDRKSADAKRLGVNYNPETEPKPTSEGSSKGPEGKRLVPSHPAAKQALDELFPTQLVGDRLRAKSSEYGIKGVYKMVNLGGFEPGQTVPESLTPITGGKEVASTADKNAGWNPSVNSLTNFQNASNIMSNSLLEPFVFKGLDLKAGAGEPIPILIPTDAAESLVGLDPLNKNATGQEQLARLKELRSKVRNHAFEVCYRNGAAAELLTTATQQAADIKANKGKAGYTEPALQYTVPTAACQPVAISKDTRDAAEKQLAAKDEQFAVASGKETAQTKVVKFRVVGVLPKIEYGTGAFDLSDIISSLMTSTLGTGFYISQEAAVANPVIGKAVEPKISGRTGFDSAIAEFTSREAQKKYMTEHSCAMEGSFEGDNPYADCIKNDKYFVQPYGNPLATLYDHADDFNSVLNWVLIIIGVLASIIMMGTIGKIIADSRKETSVFRAVGAKRMDIDQIYLLYAALLASLAFVLAFVLGLGLAVLLDLAWVTNLSTDAVLAFNSPDADKKFHVIGLSLWDMLRIYGYVLLTGLAAAAIPLMSNVRRNPIKDMREE
jgi:hypothetical protein